MPLGGKSVYLAYTSQSQSFIEGNWGMTQAAAETGTMEKIFLLPCFPWLTLLAFIQSRTNFPGVAALKVD